VLVGPRRHGSREIAEALESLQRQRALGMKSGVILSTVAKLLVNAASIRSGGPDS
jgi:hypothetical protein